ncbi:uncharacterized protein LOC117225336 [Megalopta genalis]|uniref:uncharacterized protein LOC117225336 n=1 Tax=Megalopta genalis TaxID=115081 RepID=UPI003FD62C32
MEVQTPYLNAIQLIPGETIGEKYRWIATLIKERISECNSLEEIVEGTKVPRLLAPLIQVKTAQILIKQDSKNQDNYKAISEALKSEDTEVVTEAFRVRSFFDGSNKTFTNVEYFLNQLFPFVSLNIRNRIIKNLSIRLKEPALAEEFFNAIAATYSLEQALPLLPACSESFTYDTIVKRRIVLSRKLVQAIFHKNPDLIVRYFKLSNPMVKPDCRNLHKVDIRCMCDFLAALIKKRLSAFVELYEMHEEAPMLVKLSRKRAVCFLKNGKDHLLRKPKLFIDLVPLQMISATRMEIMFPKLFPEERANFHTDSMLDYLAYYPEEKKVDLLIKSYRDVYGENILDESNQVTSKLMWLLPADERIRQAKIKIEKGIRHHISDYRQTWRCYLLTKDTIPKIKEEIAMTPEIDLRAILASQMICNCRVNNDDQALLEVLTYVRDRHKNEQPIFLMTVLNVLMELYDLPRLNKEIWSVLMDIIVRAHVKNELAPGNNISNNIVEAAIHFRILNKQPMDKEIGILVDLKSRSMTKWNILRKYPEHERTCLEACLAVVLQRYKSGKKPWSEKWSGIVRDIVMSIYEFNKDHVKKNTRVEPMSLKNYPWLLKEVETIINSNVEKDCYTIMYLKHILRENDISLFKSFCAEESKEQEIDMTKAFALLKKDPNSILSRWKEYLVTFYRNYYTRYARRFMRATRWYNEIPVKFLQQSLDDLHSKKDASCLEAIALLVHGETLTKILEPLAPRGQMLDIHHEQAQEDYTFSHYAINCAKYSNPPIPMTLLYRYCEGDYLGQALMAIVNLCRRSSPIHVLAFARTLTTQRVSVRKHGIRMMRLVAPRDQLHEFLLSQWQTEKHYSIREVLFSTARTLFAKEPGPASWSLISMMISTLGEKNASAIMDLIKMIPSFPDEYIGDYVRLIISVIDKLPQDVGPYWTSLIENISPIICNLLPEELSEIILRKFLFVHSPVSNDVISEFALNSYLMHAGDKFDARMKIFTDVFMQAVKNSWDVPNPKRPHVRDTNHSVYMFMARTVLNVRGDNQLRVLDGIRNAFLATLTPQMDPMSYLLLLFKREQVVAGTPKDFGLSIGRKLEELIDIYTNLFFGFIICVIHLFSFEDMFPDYHKDDAKLAMIEGLMEVGSPEAAVIAVHALAPVSEKKYVQRYDDLVAKLLKYDHPAVKSIVCNHINKTSHDEFLFETL